MIRSTANQPFTDHVAGLLKPSTASSVYIAFSRCCCRCRREVRIQIFAKLNWISLWRYQFDNNMEDLTELDGMKRAELQRLAKKAGIKANMKVRILVIFYLRQLDSPYHSANSRSKAKSPWHRSSESPLFHFKLQFLCLLVFIYFVFKLNIR